MISLCLLASLSLTWTANSEPDIAGYKVCYGPVSGRYVAAVDVGNVTLVEVPRNILSPGVPIFFTVLAYNTSGMESDKSNEVSYQPPIVQPELTIEKNGFGDVELSWVALAGQVYYVEARNSEREPWESSGPISVPADTERIKWVEVNDQLTRIFRVRTEAQN